MQNYWDKWDVIIGKIKELKGYQITFIIRRQITVPDPTDI